LGWHIDDLIGRYQQHEPNIKIVSYPAIAEKDEFWHNATKPLRCSGQPLFKELKSLDFLIERKKLMTESSWQSEYQQNPITVGGGVLPIENLKIMPYWNPVGSAEIRASIRYWDRAGTEGGGNYSAGVLMHALNDGRYVISHIERGQWSAYVREKNIRRWAEDDARVYANYEVGIEQEERQGRGRGYGAQPSRFLGVRGQGDRLEGNARQPVRRHGAEQRRADNRRQLDTGVRARGRSFSQWQVRRPDRRLLRCIQSSGAKAEVRLVVSLGRWMSSVLCR
jgi:hypothetical protein